MCSPKSLHALGLSVFVYFTTFLATRMAIILATSYLILAAATLEHKRSRILLRASRIGMGTVFDPENLHVSTIRELQTADTYRVMIFCWLAS